MKQETKYNEYMDRVVKWAKYDMLSKYTWYSKSWIKIFFYKNNLDIHNIEHFRYAMKIKKEKK